LEKIHDAGPLRRIIVPPRGVAQAPTDADFAQAAVWRIHLSPPPQRDLILRVHYVGDVARFVMNGKLLIDNFYNGTPFDVGIPAGDAGKDMELQILPLQKNAPVYLAPEAKGESGTSISGVDCVERREWIVEP